MFLSFGCVYLGILGSKSEQYFCTLDSCIFHLRGPLVDFLTTLNSLHPSLSFTMELPIDNKISFISIEIIKNRTKIDTQVYRKPTNTGLLHHFQSHQRYKDCLLQTMIHWAYALSSMTEAFNQECTRLRSIFTQLDYPLTKINSTITTTIQSFSFGTREENKEDSNIV